MTRFNAVLIVVLLGVTCFATGISAQVFTLQGYVDSYIASDNSKYGDPNFDAMRTYSPLNVRKNEFGLNVAQLSASVDADRYYGTFTLHYGDFTNTSWDPSYPMIQEAFAGFKFSKMISVDAGYFTTFIGNEAVLPKDNWLTSHSLAKMMEPYYHAGIRGHFQITDEFRATLLILNSLLSFDDNNENKTIGLNLAYETENFGVSYAGAFGNEVPGNTNGNYVEGLTTMFHNVNFNFNVSEDFMLKAQFDMASTAAPEEPEDAESLATTAFALQGIYKFMDQWSVAARFAYIMNEDMWASMPPVNGMGLTLGVQYAPTVNSYIRLEGRMLSFDEGEEPLFPGKVFHDGEEPTNSRMEVALNFGVAFDLLSTTP